MTTPVVTFNYATWAASYPELAGVSEPLATAYFNRAALIFGNVSTNAANRDGNLEALLYLLTAHITWLNAPRDPAGNPASMGRPPAPIIGRINSASEGSVSVGAEWTGGGSPTEAWYLQSRYGAEFWAATAQYRTFRYVAQPTYVPSAIFPQRLWWGR